jgi:DNA-binding CsgD family transcriptional regulator
MWVPNGRETRTLTTDRAAILAKPSEGGPRRGRPGLFSRAPPEAGSSPEMEPAAALAPVFVGREQELAVLGACLEAVAAGSGAIALLVGEPGIGKTRLAEEAASHAQRGGARVLWGHCYEGEGAPAYWPWVQVLRAYARDAEPQAMLSDMRDGAAAIAQVVLELRAELPPLPGLPALEPAQARFRFFDSVATFFGNAGRRQPLVLILDDLHWADQPSLLLLQFLAHTLRDARLLVIGTYRDVDIDRAHPLAQSLAALTRQPLTRQLTLHGLSELDVARFIAEAAGQAPPEPLVAAVAQHTEGNPFFVAEVVRLLASEGRLGSALAGAPAALRVPQSVRELIGRRLVRLSATCIRLLSSAAVIGREFPIAVLRRVSEASGAQLLEALEEGMAARLLAPVPSGVAAYRFTHTLIRECLYEELGPAARASLHQRVGESLEALSDTESGAHLAELAHHFVEAAPLAGPEKAIAYVVRAAERATAVLAYEETARYYRLALRLLELRDRPDERQRGELLLALGEALDQAGDRQEARSTFRAATEPARAWGAAELLARAALGVAGVLVLGGVVDGEAVALLEEALVVLAEGDSILRARVLARLAQELYFTPARERRAALSHESVAMARRLGHRATLAAALFSRCVAIWEPGNPRERLTLTGELLRLADETGNRELTLQGYRWHVGALLELGDIQAADRALATHSRVADELRQPLYRFDAVRWRATQALLEGNFPDAERLIAKALELGQRVLSVSAALYALGQRFSLYREQGRLREMGAELERTLAAAIERYPTLPTQRCVLARLYCELGRRDEARQLFEQLAAEDFAAMYRDLLWLTGMSLLVEVCVTLGDVSRAARLYELLLPYASQVIVAGSAAACYGAVARYLGLLATALGRWQEAARHFEDALAMNTRLRARPFTAYTQHEYAVMLLARGAPGDRQHADGLLAEALTTAETLGMRRLGQQVHELRTRTRSAYPGGLTRREVDVLRLIAAGRSNREIAHSLVISHNTVLRHVSNILSKTGAANRAEAAAYAARQGLAP